ncbi:Phosphatidate phosphatase APP1 [Microbacterium sp. LKL04]|uniref:App1 family protein n=1 Tax=unclassified Microbacterium TaxID=2609290 RepID=UPI000875BA38|nr:MULTISPECIES: phosphatase domain-containing protein [unclassified Microbacterium]MDQ1127176.1 phosphatidate phosphatase APP1 [Microbacterium sp. SORGH_AS_0505]SCY15031.1 Phosphatidate phosphatase APP1 [Microbacterium sp. LKL04]
MASSSAPDTKVLWLARLEYRFHSWRENRARARGRRPTVAAFPGYGSTEWVRVLGRVLIPPKAKRRERGDYAGVRGWRSFAAVPIAHATVSVVIDGVSHEVTADRGGVIDAVLPASLSAGWQTITMSVEEADPVDARVFIVGDDIRFGVISDVDDTVMVTALPRPFVAAWNSFVLNEHARQPVPGMAVLLERLARENPGSPILYLSTGAWNVAPTLVRFQRRHLFPLGAMLLTDWGPTHDRWFRSGKEHKKENLRRLADEFPHIDWLLIGDDGQHDDEIYTQFTIEHPEQVAAVAIRRLTPAEAVLAGGRTAVDDHSAAGVPWVTGDDGAELLERLTDVDIVRDVPTSS